MLTRLLNALKALATKSQRDDVAATEIRANTFYAEGHSAFFTNERCHFSEGTPEYDLWMRGFAAAEEAEFQVW